MEQPLFSVRGGTAPAVLLGSGPGPAPALDLPGRTAPVPPAQFGIRGPNEYMAILDRLERETGLRGWMLSIFGQSDEFDLDTRPKHHFSRAGAQPPFLAARLTALQTLGYEPVDAGAPWRWQETVTLNGKHVTLFACLDVRQVPQHREVAL